MPLDGRGGVCGQRETVLDHPRVAVAAVVPAGREDLDGVGAAGGAQRTAQQVRIAGLLVVEVGQVGDAA